MMLELTIEEGAKRIDLFLAEVEKIQSRSKAQRLIKEGRVRLNGSAEGLTPKTPLQEGDRIEVELAESQEGILAVKHELEILFEDEHLLVVNKPKGMVVHPAAGHQSDTLVNYLAHHCSLSSLNAERPGIVHRIDKDTSGLLVVAKNNVAHEGLAKQFFAHTIERVYLGLCWASMPAPMGTVDQPLGRHPKDRKKRAVRPGGKEAITHWRVIEELGGLNLMSFTLETGRTHQIRAHMAHMGHALLGDGLYGSYRNFQKLYPPELLARLKEYRGQALHAFRLGFVHPAKDEWMSFEAQPPEEMAEVIAQLQNWKKTHHESRIH